MEMSSIIWDLIESEARERYYVNDCEEPAFLIGGGVFARKGKLCSLYMNTVCELGSFSSFKKAREKLKEIVAKAKLPVKLYRIKNNGQRVLFAEKEAIKK